MKISHKEKAEILILFVSVLTLPLSLSFSQISPSRHHLNPAEICNHYRVTAWHTMTRQNIHLAMFYFSEEPNCRKNKQVVSKLGRRSNISGMPTYQTFDLQWTCQSPIRQCVLKNLQRLLNCPQHTTIFPVESTPLFLGPTNTGKSTEASVHPCRRAGSV